MFVTSISHQASGVAECTWAYWRTVGERNLFGERLGEQNFLGEWPGAKIACSPRWRMGWKCNDSVLQLGERVERWQNPFSNVENKINMKQIRSPIQKPFKKAWYFNIKLFKGTYHHSHWKWDSKYRLTCWISQETWISQGAVGWVLILYVVAWNKGPFSHHKSQQETWNYVHLHVLEAICY